MNLLSKKYLFFHLLILIVFSGCSSEVPGLKELKQLCEQDAGLTVYKTVEEKGYYDDYTNCHHCWQNLIRSPFEFLEFCDFESERHPLAYILNEYGCYRLSKVPRFSGQCHEEVDEEIAKMVVEPFPEFNKKQCIQVKKLDQPESLVGFYVDSKENWINKSKGTLIRKALLSLRKVNSNELLARDVSYQLITENVGTELATSPIGCDSLLITNEPSSEYRGTRDKVFIETVLKANN